jgi:hypothetical protein
MAVPVSYYFSNFAVFIYILNDVFIHSFQNCRNNPIDKFHIRAIPFKSTWGSEISGVPPLPVIFKWNSP